MDSWVRFSAQSQARERLCRCGPARERGVREGHTGYGGPQGPRRELLGARPAGIWLALVLAGKMGKLRHELASGDTALGAPGSAFPV